jgi:hypothetical protein
VPDISAHKKLINVALSLDHKNAAKACAVPFGRSVRRPGDQAGSGR